MLACQSSAVPSTSSGPSDRIVIVSAVAATSSHTAEEAVRSIEVEYEVLPSVVDATAAMDQRDTAMLAALRDPRFSPVAFAELPSLAYEVSVLSPLRRVTDVAHIKVGEHGLIMKNGNSEGLLLPQVPVEQKWDRQTFLEQTCKKAGMNTNCWKEEDTDIFSFTAVVFSEHQK